jgi:hypothetical protein
MFSATAYNHAYMDTGLFCIHASAPPANVHEMVEVIVKELVNMAGALGQPELQVSHAHMVIVVTRCPLSMPDRCYKRFYFPASQETTSVDAVDES